jgi:uncharacterized protein (DUF433 family)
MSLKIDAEDVPLTIDADGTMRVGGTRITLDAIVALYEDGLTPEQILDEFDTLRLDDVYATITYYLRHRADVAGYLRQRAGAADLVRQEVARRAGNSDLRDRLLARKPGGQTQ